MEKKVFIFALISTAAVTITAFTACSSKRASTVGSSSIPASLVSSDSTAQDSATQPDSSEPAVSYAPTASSSAASSSVSAVTASGASAIKTGVVKSGLTVTVPATKVTAKAKTPAKPSAPAKAPSKAPAKTGTGTTSKKPSNTAPASKPSTTKPSKPASNPYAGYTAWVDTHNQDIKNIKYVGDTYANSINDTVTNSSTAPFDVQWIYDTPANDYGNGSITLEQLKAKFNKTYQVGFQSKHKYVVTAIYTDSAQYSRANLNDIPNEIKAAGILNKKYSGLYYDFCYGYYNSNPKIGTAVRVTFILKQIA